MKVGHIAVSTPDLNKSVEFYKLLGGEPVMEDVFDCGDGRSEHIIHMKFDGETTVELIQPSHDDMIAYGTGIIQHLCFEVENVDETVAMLRSKGVDTFAEDEPHIEPIFGGIRVMFLEGPSGESIELLQNLK